MIALLALTADPAIGPYLRGRLWMAGVRGDTPLPVALDVIEAVSMDCPAEALRTRRRKLDIQLAIAQAQSGRVDRDSWGVP